jgi:hypothetical protein
LALLECFAEEGPKFLSPNCAAVFGSLFHQRLQLLGDAGGTANACNPQYSASLQGDGATFCSVIGDCLGGSAYCNQVICPACSAVDGLFLGEGLGNAGPVGSFGGLCSVSRASPCADLNCILDAAPKVLSPGCAAAVTALVEGFQDGGFDGG